MSTSSQTTSELVTIVPKRGIFNITAPDGTQTAANIVAQATILEHHQDEMEITDHPVEYGSSIVDHAFKRPSLVTLHLGWSSSPSGSSDDSDLVTVTQSARIEQIYDNLLQLQYSRSLFTLYTGKRVYGNMLCKSLITETDFKSANSLPITMECKEVILVQTSTVSLNAASQANPSVTASPTTLGGVSPIPVSLASNPSLAAFGESDDDDDDDDEDEDEVAPAKAYKIPSVNQAHSLTTQIGNITCNLKLQWNSNSSLWQMDIADINNKPILQGIPLVANTNLLKQFNYLGLGSKLVAQTTGAPNVPPTYDNLGTASSIYNVIAPIYNSTLTP